MAHLIADLASRRRSEFVPATHGGWYLDVLAQLPVALDAVTLRTALQLIHEGNDEDSYTADSGKSLNV